MEWQRVFEMRGNECIEWLLEVITVCLNLRGVSFDYMVTRIVPFYKEKGD